MQLIDTDTDIDFQTKMSTMQQESIEKFSLIENVCSDITNGNDECVNNEVVEDVCVTNAEENEQTTNLTKPLEDSILNNKRDEECNAHKALCDEETVENKSSELVDVRSVEDKHKEEEKENDEIAIKSNILSDKENIEISVNSENNSKNENKVINKTNEDVEQNCDTEHHKVNEPNKDDIMMDVTFEEEDMSNNLMENKLNDDCEIDDKNEDQKNEDVEMDITFHNDKGKNNLTEDIIEEDVEKNIEIDDKIQEQSEMEMDVIYEDDKLSKSLTEDKIEEGVIENSDSIEKQNKEDIEMDTLFENAIGSVIEVKNKLEELHDDMGEKDVYQELIETDVLDNVDNSAIRAEATREIKETNQLKDYHNVNEEDNRKDSKLKEKEVNNSVTEKNLEKDVTAMTEKLTVHDDLKIIETKNIETDIATSNVIEEQVEGIMVINDSQNKNNKKNIEINVTTEVQTKEINSLTEVKNNTEITTTSRLETFRGTKEDTLKELKEIDMQGNLEEHDINKINQERFEGKLNIGTEILSKPMELSKDNSEIQEQLQEKGKANSMTSYSGEDQADTEMEQKREHEITHNEAVNEILEKTLEQDTKERSVDNKPKELDQIYGQKEDQNSEMLITGDKLENNQQALLTESDEQIDENLDATKKDLCITVKIDKQSENCNHNQQEKHGDGNKNIHEDKTTNKVINNNKTEVTQMDTDEVIDIADEKGDDLDQSMGTIEKESQNKDKTKNMLLENTGNADILVNDNPATDSTVHDTNDLQIKLKESKTNQVEKMKLTHISKLSNTLDILSDDEEDLIKVEPQNNNSYPNEKQCTSINLDDDDDIMLIDEELKPKDHNHETETLAKPESEVVLKEEIKVESIDKEEQSLYVCETKKDTIQTEVTGVDGIKTDEFEQEAIKQEESPIEKKPLVPVNFLNTCLKNLADMTRDDLEEFCVLKIVEGIVDRSNLSEIKSQLKSMAQHIEDYKKKFTVLSKQNRDLQVVLKTVQEEQKKKSHTPIIPLKITRSVGMQVFMTDKVAVRKKIVTGQTNAATNSGTNKKGAHSKTQKISPSTNNSPPIPVPRLVPAVSTGNSNNVKTQSPNLNTAGKTQVTCLVNSPTQAVPNCLPATTPPAQKTEKRPHSRMQQTNSFTVDLTDDEPPTKVVSRNITPPVRLVPPQNLLAPNRQPFGANVSNPRKVYIPISGSQTPVGVKPGQTIMLKTIPQGTGKRHPTPSSVKSNSNTVRMQRVTSRHPAPLPDSVKQYQPLNWKALPPAPELKLSKVDNGIVISWKIEGYLEENYEEIASYQLFAYQETSSPPSSALWKKIGDVKALPLPMACTLTQFMAGFKYYFAVRAVDIRSRLGPFSLPGSILLLNKL